MPVKKSKALQKQNLKTKIQSISLTLSEFKNSLTSPAPPPVPILLQALWHDAHGNWDKAHDLAQEVNTKDGSWVHAYLHRKDGDRSNAHYWYNRADRKMPAYSLEQEWDEMVVEFLSGIWQL
jgi:hypothetical protein